MYNIRFKESEICPSKGEINRPFCGWYEIIRANLTENGISCPKISTDCRLVLIEINISLFKDGLIGSGAIISAYRFLEKVTAEHEIILRWVYDFDGHGIENEPEKIETVLTHIMQTAGVSMYFDDNILTTQGLLVGSWGEMHDSKFLSPLSLKKLFDEMRSCDKKNLITVRTPEILEKLLNGCYTDSDRTGIFNDGIMGSENDLGTFNYTRDEAAQMFKKIAENVPYGGEIVCGENINAEECVKYLENSAATYMNRGYDEKAISALKSCDYNGVTAYEFLGAHMGYRMKIMNVKMNEKKLVLSLENNGFARNYKPLEITAVFETKEGYKEVKCEGKSFINEGKNEEYYCDAPAFASKLYYRMTVGKKPADFDNKKTKNGFFAGELKSGLF